MLRLCGSFRRLLVLASVSTMLLVSVLLARTFFFARVLTMTPPPTPLPTILAGAGSRFAAALQIPTVSHAIGRQETKNILHFHAFLQLSFPLVHGSAFVKRDVVNNLSLLYTVEGSSDGGRLPYLLAAHLDVVPAPPHAFRAHPKNDTFTARGAIDDKAALMAIMEALELMLSNQQRPTRTLFIAFGHDEEISGWQGAREIAALLVERGVQGLDFVLDEGFPLTQGLVPGTGQQLVAVIGVSEKGSATVELKVNTEPRHSSLPKSESSIGILATAVARLERSPQPSLFAQGPERNTFTCLVPHVTFGFQVIYSNLWLFSELLARQLELHPIGNALVRTCTAVTMFNAGVKENVVGGKAVAIVNHRVHSSSSVNATLAHDVKVISDPRVRLTVLRSREPSPVSSAGSRAFYTVANALREAFPGAVVVPGTFPAGTDTRWYLGLTSNALRTLPLVLSPAQIDTYHGNDERISLQDFRRAIHFYHALILGADRLSQASRSEEQDL